MDNSMLAGIYIRKILIQNEALLELIDANNIFPLISDVDTTFPFITYARTSMNAEYSKDGTCDNLISIEVVVASDDYDQSLYIANAVRHALDTIRYKDENITIDRIKLTSAFEQTFEDAYIQRMVFSFYAY